MFHIRLPIALRDGDLTLPDDGRILVFGPTPAHILGDLPKDRVTIYTRFKPDFDHWTAQGFDVVHEVPAAGFTCAIVCAPRSKTQAQAWLHAASAATQKGLVVLDGQKTDGVDSLHKALKSKATLLGNLSKAHGKTIWFEGLTAEDWKEQPKEIDAGFMTRPGVFSADKLDKGSMVLAAAMPDDINGRVADLGAGWGFLSAHILERPSVETLDLVEADRVALDCAQVNIDDPRARFFWDDVTKFTPDALYDVILSNPPFHTSRDGDPNIGRKFITAASKMLKPSGRFVMVANRHLPYEDTMAECFRVVEDMGGTPGFKLLGGLKPLRAKR